ncbi:DUF4232 domain-containing protein [Streptomyces sp. NPDC050485]|uniref:DUF4232 domain-containing protein n=1 Tax=Streptomyces sp. NPDC050485 TaxID=3365617 RepID=UPI003795B1C5
MKASWSRPIAPPRYAFRLGAQGRSRAGVAFPSRRATRCLPHTPIPVGTDGGGVPDKKGSQTQAAVWLKNVGSRSRSCTLQGFPGVDIQDNLTAGHTVSLPRSSKAATEVTLKPGAHTSFLFTLLPAEGGTPAAQRVEPGMLIVTPPSEKQHFQLTWPYGGEILNQEGATHPGSYVKPIGAG